MDQNQPKSVWLRLILPICLGVFATAIYHNAIMTQKRNVDVLIAKQDIRKNQEVATSGSALFEVRTFVIHRDTPESIRNAIKPPKQGITWTTKRSIKKGEAVVHADFVVSQDK